MWEDKPSVVVTFANMPDVCAMEGMAGTYGIPGRVVPLPSCISKGCGMAWRADAEQKPAVVDALTRLDIDHEAVYDLPAGA